MTTATSTLTPLYRFAVRLIVVLVFAVGSPQIMEAALKSSGTSVTDAGRDLRQKKEPVHWDEVEDVLRVLPRRGSKGVRYYVLDQKRAELKERVEKLKAKGDIVPAILERLSREPKTEEDEAEIYNLVHILKEEEDERALPVLEHLAKSEPPTTFSMMDEGTQHKYPYHHEAMRAAENLKILRSRKEWERHLAGKDRESRRNILADIYWSSTEVETFERRGAGWKLNTEFQAPERLAELREHLSGVMKADTPWKSDVLSHMVEELRRLVRDGASRSEAEELLERIAREAGDLEVRRYATSVRRRMD